MTCRPWAALLALVLLAGATAAQEESPRVRGRRARPAPAARAAASDAQRAEERTLLYQLADAQRSLGEQIQQLKDRLDTLHGELASGQDQDSALEQEIKAARDEIKGLYVESSSVKQQIDALKDDIASVNSNVSGFRTFSGFFIATMILLLAVIFVLTIRR